MFAISLVIVTGLWTYRIGATAVVIDAVTTDLEFTVVGDDPITQPLALQSLGFTGVSRVDFPPDLAIPDAVRNDFSSGMQLKLIDPAKGSITLSRVTVPPATSVGIHEDSANAFRTGFDSPGGHGYSIDATVEGDLLIGPAGGRPERITIPAPKLVTITFGDSPAELDFTLQSSADPALTGNLKVASVGFSRVETVGPGLAAQQTSGLRSGTLTLHELGDRVTLLPAGSDLSLMLKNGELRNVGLSADGIKVHFAGTARGVRGGSGQAPANLMPSALEWLMANKRLTLVWGAVIYLFGMALAVGRWWKEGRS